MLRPLFETLRDLRGGQVIDDMAVNIQELVQAVQSTGKAGSLTMKIVVTPMKGSTEAFVIKDNISLKKPTIESAGTVLFPTPEGNLTRTHPKQDNLPGIQLAGGMEVATKRTVNG